MTRPSGSAHLPGGIEEAFVSILLQLLAIDEAAWVPDDPYLAVRPMLAQPFRRADVEAAFREEVEPWGL